jgi:phosphoribosylaminoimidazole carboxylase
LAVRILGSFDSALQLKVEEYANSSKEENLYIKGIKMKQLGWEAYYEQMEKR